MKGETEIGEYKNTMITICIVYRCVSLAISTAVYAIFSPEENFFLHTSVAVGTMLAGIMGAFLYRRYMTGPESRWMAAVLYVEMIVYGLILILSGGVFSPYLWYFISILVLSMGLSVGPKNAKNNMYRTGAKISWLWGFLCALAGSRYLPQNDFDYARMNIIIGFLLVTGSFYAIFTYMLKLDKNSQELLRLNGSLEKESVQSKQALRYAIDLYETFYIFGITDPEKVMSEMAKILSGTIAPQGCVFAKVDLMGQVQIVTSAGFQQGEEQNLFAYVKERDAFTIDKFCSESHNEQQGAGDMVAQQVEISGIAYELIYVDNLLNLVGILLRPLEQRKKEASSEEEKTVREQLYLRLAGIVLQNMDMQAMVELSVVSEEQNRIANEIHDTILQKLFAIACNLRVLETRQVEGDQKQNQKQIQGILAAMESTMRELRETIYGARWEEAEQESFIKRLEVYMEEIQYLHQIKVLLVADIDTRLMSINHKTILYRVTCEAVNNAVRHGKADQIQVSISMTEKEWIVEIKDNGVGFDKKQILQHGRGLKNMSRMILCLKGQLTIDSQPGTGTTIGCRVPRLS